jgi:hypothetical protein
MFSTHLKTDAKVRAFVGSFIPPLGGIFIFEVKIPPKGGIAPPPQGL